ncbi:hypothetical protein ABZY57_09540 [Streptomyces sp. NPDC006450]|uniref:hypothetical protein n=1 Tax=Streptomyces sp. NPDC006450 TaxID=3155458 RepID=UPI0033BAEC5D
MQRLVEDIGVVLAGRGGSRMLRILNIRLSVHRLVPADAGVFPPLVAPRVLGVDDFALYGDTYGALLVDVTTWLPLTLWESRDAERLGHWFREHPGVEVACRDGSLAYRQGITVGAPNVVQVRHRGRRAVPHEGWLRRVLLPVLAWQVSETRKVAEKRGPPGGRTPRCPVTW